MKKQNKSHGGFTLIEIMIVVAIIGLLASIAVPNYIAASNRSKQTACIQNLRRLDGAVQQWSLEARKQAGQPVALSDIRPYLKRVPICPSGGSNFADSYEVTSIDESPVCLRVITGKYAHLMD